MNKSQPEIKYVLYPGQVRSVVDGDIHFIGANTLRHLYQVPASECIEADLDRYPTGSRAREDRRIYLDTLIPLRPQRLAEDYVVPQKTINKVT